MKKIGVLALQGDFAEHAKMLREIGAQPREVRLPRDLKGLDGLIMPGGESTTFGKLATWYGLIEPLREFALSNKPMWGTCAGLIFLAKDVGRDQPTLGLMDIAVHRNAFGRQVDSFTVGLQVNGIRSTQTQPFEGVFIRAPLIDKISGKARAICTLADGTIVAARQGNLLATSFHPELTHDTRVHKYFLQMSK
jgi:5'-phosphate synthase pdxT subunit